MSDRWIVEGEAGPRWAWLTKCTTIAEAEERYWMYVERYPQQDFRIVRETRTIHIPEPKDH